MLSSGGWRVCLLAASVAAQILSFSLETGWSGYAKPVIVPSSEQVAMVASWYGPRYHGKTAANGKRFDMNVISAAHRSLPLGTMLEISYGERTIMSVVTDRGPYHLGRDLDLSRAAAYQLGFLRTGVVTVQVRIIE